MLLDGMAKTENMMEKDGKHMPMEGSRAITPFLVTLLVGTPLWFCILLPLAIVYNLVRFFVSLVVPGKQSKPVPLEQDPEFMPKTNETCLTSDSPRELDLILFGATGFTGELGAKYLSKQYPPGSNLTWGLAGRRKAALEAVRDRSCGGSRDVPIIVANATDEAELRAMVRRTKVVVSTAGPFAKYGTKLVKVCAEEGTHYCDITGEVDWVRQMIDLYDDTARRTGARIVHMCGHDCVPWDLLTLALSEEHKMQGDTIESVHFYDEVKATASGGTVATIFHSIKNRPSGKSRLGFDPLIKTPQGDKATIKYTVANQNMLGWSGEFGAWVGPFIMATVNAQCVRRGLAIHNYGPRFTYSEAIVYPNFMAGFVSWASLIAFGTVLALPPLSSLLFAIGVLPKPGEGPSVKQMDSNFLHVTGISKGSKGTRARTTMYFPTDPGYRDTARMLIEAGVVLALELDKTESMGGVWTPATCQGLPLLDRLVSTGCSYTVSSSTS